MSNLSKRLNSLSFERRRYLLQPLRQAVHYKVAHILPQELFHDDEPR